MRLVLSWLRDFVAIDASADRIAETLGLRGFEVASVAPLEDGDAVIDFEITANRPDCLSVLGLAREVATAFDRPLTPPSHDAGAKISLATLASGANDRIAVTIEDEDLCPRYAAAVADISPASSPEWLTRRLRGAGVRPISPIVDVTNYVLIELGHPTHAFDLAKLAGPEIRVRRARPGETVTTLDGVNRTLEPDMLVIADRDRAQAVGGVMGGADSEISAATKTVVLESAYFKATSVRRTSKRLGLKTEASSRFERGADANAAGTALERIVSLLTAIGAGQATGPVVDVYPKRRDPVRLHMRRVRLDALLGVAVPDADVVGILTKLGLTVTPTSDGWDVIAPTFRVDLLREVDLIEEVGRHHGFDTLEPTYPVSTAPAPPPDPRIPRDRLARQVLTASGLSETVTFGFIEAKAAEPFATTDGQKPVAVANPLSAKFDTLRPSLLPGLVDVVAHNRRHGRADVRVFELGTRFSPAGETRSVGLAWTGAATPPHWSAASRPVDFYDLSGVIARLCDALGVRVRFETARQPFLVAGQTAAVHAPTGNALGIVGQVMPSVADARGLPKQDALFVAELNLDALDAARVAASDATRPLPRYPFVVRDLSIVVPDTLPAASISGTIQAAGSNVAAPLVDVAFFDRYQGKGVPEGGVSISVRLTFQADDRTLTDAEVQQSVDTILAALMREHDAKQR